MIAWRLLLIGVVFGQCLPIASAEEKKEPTEKEIKAIIEQLVSPNPPPIVNKRGPSIEQPKGFDVKKQTPVLAARSKLLELGPVAFAALIASGEDERYSLTTCNGLSGWYNNETVGAVCRAIIFDQLQPYGYWQKGGGDPRDQAQRPGYPNHFLKSKETALAWWEKHKKKTLCEMQLEVLDWIVAEEGKLPGKFTEAEKDHLQKLRKELVKSGKPLPPGNYSANEIEMRYRD